MNGYLAKRLLGAIPTLIGVSFLTFLFIRLIPGDAIAARLGTSTALTPEQLASLRAYFGLDQPIPLQYWNWLVSLLHGDAGYSIRTGRPVFVEIAQRLPATAKGLAPPVVVRRHVLKNGLIVVVTLLGIQIGQLLGGTVVVEEIFSVPGVGRMLLAAIIQRDYALVQGAVLVIAVLFVAVNIA